MSTDRNRIDFVKSLRVDNSNNKRNVKNRPSKARFNVRVAAGLAAALLAVGGLAACKNDHKTNEVSQPQTITYSSTLTGEEKLENSVKKAEKDFLDRYLKAYNKEYGTNYMSYEAELCANSIREGIVYKVDGKLVTPGNYPALVKQQLSDYGTVTSEDGHDKVMQVIVNTEEGKTKVLGTYDQDLRAMYSGTDLSNFNSKLPELELLDIKEDVAKAIFELEQGRGSETEESLEIRVDKYNKAIKDLDKGFEIGD